VTTTVENRPERSRYEIYVDGELAGFTVYEPHGPRVALVHTEIDDRFAKHGVGSTLIRAALDDVRSQGRSVLPYCPFVRAFIAEHPEYVDLIPQAMRREFKLPAAD